MSTFDLVFGTGPLGKAVAEQLAAQGRAVKFASRSGGSGDLAHECLRIDLLEPGNRPDIADVDRLFLCAAPAYWRWSEELVPMVRGALQLAAACNAPLVFADNVYAYGPSDQPLTEVTPYRPRGPKGRARQQAAEEILQAHAKGDVHTAIVRSSDFFGPGVHLSSLGSDAFRKAASGKPVNCLGDADQPHTFHYIHDFARAMINVISNEKCQGEVWHAPADKARSMRGMVELIAAECGTQARPNVAPRWLFRVLSLFNRSMKELDEVYYLYEQPLIVDSSKYERRFDEKATPHPRAVQETLSSLGLK